MHLRNKVTFRLKAEWACTRTANMGENMKYYAKLEKHLYCKSLPLVCRAW